MYLFRVYLYSFEKYVDVVHPPIVCRLSPEIKS